MEQGQATYPNNTGAHTIAVPFVVALCTAKAKKGLTFGQIASEIERDEVWVAAAFFGQAKFSEEELRRVCEVLELNVQPSGLSTWWPNRGLGPFPPQDPIVYQLYEGVLVYGQAIKAIIHEKFGDGVMSLVDCKVQVDKPDPNGDRVVLSFDGKFVPYEKW